MSGVIVGAELAALQAAGFAQIQSGLATVQGGLIQMQDNIDLFGPDITTRPVTVSTFSMAESPVTHLAYEDYLSRLGSRRFALVDIQTGAERLLALGESRQEVLAVAVDQLPLDLLLPQFDRRMTIGGMKAFAQRVLKDEVLAKSVLETMLQGALHIVHIRDYTRPTHHLVRGRDWQAVTGLTWFEALVYALFHGVHLPTEAEQQRGVGLIEDRTRGTLGSIGGCSITIWDDWKMTWEWTRDWYDFIPKSPAIDPKGPGSGTKKVLRGHSPAMQGDHLTYVHRDPASPDRPHPDAGFRVVVHMI